MSIISKIKNIFTILARATNKGGKRALSSIKYIVLHYTANDGDHDTNNGNYFKNNTVYASAHDFIDSDSVTHSVPYDEVAYSVGKKFGNAPLWGKCTNNNSISIELCDDNKNGKVYPTQATIDNAIVHTVDLCIKFKVNPRTNVVRHWDVCRKRCPEYWVNDSKWKKEFLNKVIALYDEKTKKKTTATTVIKEVKQTNTKKTTTTTKKTATNKFKPYTVIVKSSDGYLNIREKADAKSKKVGMLKNGNTRYTIVEEKNGFGRLKSGKGWISLKFTRKA